MTYRIPYNVIKVIVAVDIEHFLIDLYYCVIQVQLNIITIKKWHFLFVDSNVLANMTKLE